MQVPLQIAFHGVAKDDRIEELIREQVDKLDRLHERLSSCRVVVEQPHRSRESHPGYEVRIDMRVPPHHELVVRERSQETQFKGDAYGVVISAFEAAKRQLNRLKERQNGMVKTHERQQAQGVVDRLREDHGFVRTLDDRQVYFHRNSVLGDRFDDLRVGAAVSFTEEMGREGPQASSLHVVQGRPKP